LNYIVEIINNKNYFCELYVYFNTFLSPVKRKKLMRERKKSEGKERGEEKEEKNMRRRGVTYKWCKFL
jgi:hypothetical protein